ncbi:MAG: non-heme iron oxygenase ferredoxin subunit [Acidimicrobiia bacterium]|nr:non-heme iron oxygenase ferredoxin subunit [Acidimicrobiia bacterium]
MAELRVCATGDVPESSARRFDIEGHRLCVVHLPSSDSVGAWYVIGDECSHADYSLAEGDLWPEDCAIECPQHGSTFSLATGEPRSFPATRPVPTYSVQIDGDNVMVVLP